MLVDPKFREYSEEEIRQFVKAIASEMTEEEAREYMHRSANPPRPDGHPVGIFYAWQLEHDIVDIKNYIFVIPGITRQNPDDESNEQFLKFSGHEIWELTGYGVCDNVEQILARYNVAELPDRKFCIGIYPIEKKDQPAQGGWRWHKWGQYIGTYEIKHEYLYDEDIDVVFVYHIFEIE